MLCLHQLLLGVLRLSRVQIRQEKVTLLFDGPGVVRVAVVHAAVVVRCVKIVELFTVRRLVSHHWRAAREALEVRIGDCQKVVRRRRVVEEPARACGIRGRRQRSRRALIQSQIGGRHVLTPHSTVQFDIQQ